MRQKSVCENKILGAKKNYFAFASIVETLISTKGGKNETGINV